MLGFLSSPQSTELETSEKTIYAWPCNRWYSKSALAVILSVVEQRLSVGKLGMMMKSCGLGFRVAFVCWVAILTGCDNQNADGESTQQKIGEPSQTQPSPVLKESGPENSASVAKNPAQKVPIDTPAASAVQDSKDNNVDRITYIGYKLYQRVGCMKCHGPTAEGGAAFPNLLKSVKRLSKDQIIEIAKNGKGIMPPHKQNSYLAKFTKKEGLTSDQGFEAIYTYLEGRSSGRVSAKKLEKPEA